ncbi:aldehyde dehydrogenase family protein [Thalassotalea sp. 1_MG-2023]|uniref:aldehyde dehydrogenase family protein n=1 Tax=Thalassotalea sp. 1_MG-2023 TaxID=3062680 RepID=UPI0026E14650|nr:aldehyde dehydrogenase family protein [Thalassotalea sp. 1_MG-2023]MDO6428417.1 aldehyde dehydrogenase family protein [Thalassotalea sp. 1_MG-2023]
MTFKQLVADQKAYFNTLVTRDIQWRKTQLRQIKKMVQDNEQRFLDVLSEDLGKPSLESWMTEVSYVAGDVDHVIKRLNKWSKKRKVSTPIVAQPGRSYIQPEPLGSVLIIGAWNYPVQLVLAPLVAAISAGNCAVIKPSELAPATSALLASLVPQYLDSNAISVVEGAVDETTALLELPFDHIMYTGNGQVARIIMAAAAKNLTPVTLELGGKSPVFVDQSADLNISAQRIAWGKWLNAGQTCIAPDYIMVEHSVLPELITALKNQLQTMFGANPKESKSYGRIVNQRHCERIASYLTSGDIVHGGDIDINERFISPTIVVDPDLDSPLMTEEIFGAILPIITVKNFEAAKATVISKDKPLAAYLFTRDKTQEQQWLNEISSGSLCVNDVIMFNAVPDLPFGGVGPSGMGQYSGKAGFDNFSHLKSVLKRPFLKDLPVRFAPFTSFKFKLLKLIRHL